jgi:hypothetical protein
VSEEEAGERTEGLGVELAEDLYGLRRVLRVSILCLSRLSTSTRMLAAPGTIRTDQDWPPMV